MEITDIVNLNSYPIIDSDGASAVSLRDRCRRDLAKNRICAIPDFVTEDALEVMAAEAVRLQEAAYHNNSLRNCYLHQQKDPSLAEDHVRNLQDRSSVRMIAYDQLASDSPLKTFYQSDAVRKLVAGIVDEGDLFPNEDPYQPANYVSYREGDESSWHFDEDNSFTMTLMIQASENGGLFEMSPDTRSDTSENYDHVKDVLMGSCNDEIVSVGRNPGELCIFRGSHSLHRVTPVSGSSLRIMGVFVYELSPGCVGDPEVNATIYGPRVAA
jgi:hypothetical protein